MKSKSGRGLSRRRETIGRSPGAMNYDLVMKRPARHDGVGLVQRGQRVELHCTTAQMLARPHNVREMI